MLIGQRIKELRGDHKISLTELSKRSGVQLATLSRIENLKMTGTLASHISIARALGVDITQLYKNISGEEKRVDVQTKKSATDIFTHSPKSSYEILTAKVLSKKMMPTMLKVEPGGKTNKEQNSPGTEKFLFVVEGKVGVSIDDEAYSLVKHDTLYFDASLPHFLENPGKVTVRVLCVTTPVAL